MSAALAMRGQSATNPFFSNWDRQSDSIKSILFHRQDSASTVLLHARSFTRKLYEVTYNGETLVFNTCQFLTIEKKDDYFCIDYPVCEIFIAEKSAKEAMRCFKEEFFIAWHEYAEELDDNLDKGARQLKQWLLNNVRLR